MRDDGRPTPPSLHHPHGHRTHQRPAPSPPPINLTAIRNYLGSTDPGQYDFTLPGDQALALVEAVLAAQAVIAERGIHDEEWWRTKVSAKLCHLWRTLRPFTTPEGQA